MEHRQRHSAGDPSVWSVVLSYVILAALWIVFSDKVLAAFVADADQRIAWSIFKGWAFVFVTGAFLYGLTTRLASRLKRTRDEALTSEERFRRIFEDGPVGMSTSDLEGRFLSANAALCRMLGYTESELKNLTFKDVTHREHLASNVEQVERLRRGEIALYQTEKRYLRKNGEVVWGAITISVLRSEEGKFVSFIAMVQDITARRQAEAALRESEERFRRSIMEAPFPIIIHAEDGAVLDLNTTLMELSGYRREQIRTIDDWTALAYGERKQAMRALIKKLFDLDHRLVEGEFEIRTASGQMRLWNFSSAPLGKLPDGRRTVISMAMDVTAQKDAEKRLRQSEKLEAIGQLAGGIAHDFNNQLAGIMGNAELLLAQLAEPPLRRCADDILKASARAADLTRQLLAFARRGRQVSTLVDLHSIIQEVCSLLKHSIDKRIVIRQCLAAQPSTVTGDPTLLQSALLNLALNARDAMPQGGTLTFSTAVEVEPPAVGLEQPSRLYLLLGVTDTGTGMDAETQAHLFEPFFTTKPQGVGTGLGLAAVYGTVTSHGGTIKAVSELGRGSQFTIRLPLVSAPMPAASEERLASVRTPGAHILIIDDETSVRETLTAMLKFLGFRVTACAQSEQALEVYAGAWQDIDLVLIDMMMPRMGGHETFRALRAINPRVKALLLSGYSLNGEAQRSLDEGALGFVEKPFQLAEISRRIAEALNG